MPERTVAIIQARMGSTRFPAKMTAPFLGAPILSWVIQRLQRCTSLDDIILATTNLDRDQVLIDLANENDIQAFSGDEENVLARFIGAANQADADLIIRVCADNPLIAPEAVDQVIDFFKSVRPDYAFNHVPKGGCMHPDGFGAEILSTAMLSNILKSASKPEHFEHVTSYIWDHADAYDIQYPECPHDWLIEDKSVRFDVDHPDDLRRLETTLSGIGIGSSIQDVLATWRNTMKAHTLND